MGSIPNINAEFSDLKNNMNGIRGNGYRAEYANNVFDKFNLKHVENTASILDEHGRQVIGIY